MPAGSSPRGPGADPRTTGRAHPRCSARRAFPTPSLPASSDDPCSLLRLCNLRRLGRRTRNVSTFFFTGQRGLAGHNVQTHVIQGGPAVHGLYLRRHRCRESTAFPLGQPLHVSAEHDRGEEAGELVYRTEGCNLVVQPGLDLFESGSFETPCSGPGVSIVFIVMPVLEVVPKALLFHGFLRRPRGPGDVAFAPALGYEAPTRLQGTGQSLEEAVVVRYPMERRGGEDQIHRLLDLERQEILALHPDPRLPGKPPPRRLDHGP